MWSPLENSPKDKVPFNWGPEHQEAFNQMKKKRLSEPPYSHITIQRKKLYYKHMQNQRLGACLLQEQRPVYFMSKALTEVH